MPKQAAYILKFILVFACYFMTAKIGLSFDAVSGFATLVWPPTGIAIASLFLFGYKLWPAIFLGAYLVNLSTGASLLVALGMGLGNAFEALSATYITRCFVRPGNSLSELKSLLGFICLAIPIGAFISATIGVTSLYLGGIVNLAAYNPTWLAWWVGDVLGGIIIGSFLIFWLGKTPVFKINFTKTAEIVAALLFLFVCNMIVFESILPEEQKRPLAYLVFPPLVYLSLRFGPHGVTFGVIITYIFAILGTSTGFGAFAQQQATLSNSLLPLQFFLGTVSITMLVLAEAVEERRKALLKIQELNEGLEERVRERTEELEVHLKDEQAIRLMREKQFQKEKLLERKERDFVSVASHQLLTPLALVSGYISMLISGKVGNIDSEAKKYLEESFQGTERMSELVKQLLATSRIESGNIKIEKSNFDLSQLAKRIATELKPKLDSKKLILKVLSSKKLLVRADKEQTRQVLTNVLDNAIKYTDKGEITLTFSSKANMNYISVSDTGVGISPEDLPHIFEKFYFSQNWVSKQSESHGLGLYISRLLLELMDGTLSVESKVMKGSTFIIGLPKA